MTPEHAPEPRLPHPTPDEGTPNQPDTADPYQAAEVLFNARVEQLQQEGLLRRPSEITDEEELDDHFDDLSRLYRQICLEMGLAWPPLPLDTQE